ncbi:rRNA N(6)-adenosine-methyltransferase METTL5-like isoform X2 [Clavelina lepadiformis]|uniref:rRNA N(6)-adenosine-methyltransferase METTL5-like isoform X2 n=1 Tax=Clavelina lepadiformis TaxID=159417 RepID=UPI004040FF10
MKLRQLEIALEGVEGFRLPKVNLEQYVTTPHLAETRFGDIYGKNVIDLGCGSGILSMGSAMLGCSFSLGVDIDADALEIFQENKTHLEVEDAIDALQADVSNLNAVQHKRFDTVVMNPPFGTKLNKGADMMFLHTASKLARNAIYSLHKTSTRDHVFKKAGSFGLVPHVLAEMRYNLEASYGFHKKKSLDINVDFIRFTYKCVQT